MGKEKSAAHKYLVEANPLREGQPASRPYLDIFTKDTDKPVFHCKDITVSHVWLAFKCEASPSVRATKPRGSGGSDHQAPPRRAGCIY